MIPLVDVTPLQDGNRFRGIGTYVRGLLAGLDELGAPHRTLARPGEAPVAVDRRVVRVGGPWRRPPRWHATPGLDERVHLTSPSAATTTVDGPYVVTVHDPIPLLFPHWYLRGRAGRRRRRRFDTYLAQLRDAAHLVAVSRATAEAFGELLDRPADDFTVTPLAPADLPDPSGWRWGGGAPYVLVAATHEPHKNLAFALRVVAALPAGDRPAVVVSGVRDERPWQRLARTADELGVRLDHVGHVDRQRLADLYAGAIALLMPSLFEGFGLPTLEAMACGTPVVVSDRGALPEVVGDAGDVLPLDPAAWTARLQALVADPRGGDADAGRRHAARFTWARTAEATLRAHEALG